ncbi:MAG: nickel/cobalt transporter [Spirochaetia bacterium]
MKKTVFVFVILFLAIFSVFSQDNPFFSSGNEGGAQESREESTGGDAQARARDLRSSAPGLFSGILAPIQRFQRGLNSELSRLSRVIRQEGNNTAVFLLLGIAFLYGLIHALGPGHRKMVIFSYFISEDAKARDGFIAGNLMALIHALSALVLVSVFFLIFRTGVSGGFASVSETIDSVSYGLIAAAGVFLLVLHLLEMRKKQDHDPDTDMEKKPKNLRTLIPVIVSAGLVPCPGVLALLVFCISIDAFWLGVLAAFLMSLGMAVTISGFGILAIFAKKGVVNVSMKNQRIGAVLHHGLDIAGSVLIIIFGLLMLAASLS